MSASLVGSEMCIRDRILRRRPRPPGRAHCLPDALGRRRRRGGAPPGIRGCLLYTSDAADDM
eukprot:4572866-Alexandrium_andersonii.AAC.1